MRYLTVEAAAAGRATVTNKGKTREILLPAKLCRKLLKHAKKKEPPRARYSVPKTVR